MTQHHWQCDFHADLSECNCGLLGGPRAWWMDQLPESRAMTEDEMREWRLVIRGKAQGTDKQELEAAHSRFEGDCE